MQRRVQRRPDAPAVKGARPRARRVHVLVDLLPVQLVVGEVAVLVEVEVRQPVVAVPAVVRVRALEDDRARSSAGTPAAARSSATRAAPGPGAGASQHRPARMQRQDDEGTTLFGGGFMGGRGNHGPPFPLHEECANSGFSQDYTLTRCAGHHRHLGRAAVEQLVGVVGAQHALHVAARLGDGDLLHPRVQRQRPGWPRASGPPRRSRRCSWPPRRACCPSNCLSSAPR